MAGEIPRGPLGPLSSGNWTKPVIAAIEGQAVAVLALNWDCGAIFG